MGSHDAPPWIPDSAGKTRVVVVVPHPDAVPMVGPGRGPLRLRTRSTLARILRTVTPPWIPVSTGKTREVVVVPHPDAVPMVGPGRGPLRLRTRSTLARILRTVTPPWIPVSTGKTREVVVVTFLRRYDGGWERGCWLGMAGCGGSRARPLGTGLRRHDEVARGHTGMLAEVTRVF